MQAMRDTRQHPARRGAPTTVYADLETGSCAKMSIVPDAAYSPPVHMIRLTKERKIAPFVWVHPDNER